MTYIVSSGALNSTHSLTCNCLWSGMQVTPKSTGACRSPAMINLQFFTTHSYTCFPLHILTCTVVSLRHTIVWRTQTTYPFCQQTGQNHKNCSDLQWATLSAKCKVSPSPDTQKRRNLCHLTTASLIMWRHTTLKHCFKNRWFIRLEIACVPQRLRKLPS